MQKELNDEKFPFFKKMLKLHLWDMKHENMYITLNTDFVT